MVQAHNITKSFQAQVVLRGVDLSVEKGDVVAILGPSGSGKTTLLRCLNFLETADGGTLEFDGETFQMGQVSKKDIARLRKKTAFVFQSYNLFSNKTALQNVTEGLIIGRGMDKAKAAEIGRRALDKVGLSDRYGYYPHQLSGGQQQRVSIARALAGSPSLILADEPTGALDSRTSREVLDFLKELNREGNTIVIITHDSSIALEAKRVVRIHDGKINFDGDVNEYAAIL